MYGYGKRLYTTASYFISTSISFPLSQSGHNSLTAWFREPLSVWYADDSPAGSTIDRLIMVGPVRRDWLTQWLLLKGSKIRIVVKQEVTKMARKDFHSTEV